MAQVGPAPQVRLVVCQAPSSHDVVTSFSVFSIPETWGEDGKGGSSAWIGGIFLDAPLKKQGCGFKASVLNISSPIAFPELYWPYRSTPFPLESKWDLFNSDMSLPHQP